VVLSIKKERLKESSLASTESRQIDTLMQAMRRLSQSLVLQPIFLADENTFNAYAVNYTMMSNQNSFKELQFEFL